MKRDDGGWRVPLALLNGFALGTFYLLFLRPQMVRWGARLGEPERRLPGDDVIPSPNLVATRAISIDAPPEAVWPWLAQMGRDRTGWYSFDILDNNGIPSATYLRRDLEAPRPGLPLDMGLRVLEVEADRHLLIGGFDLPVPLEAALDLTMLYLLERMSDGSTRLLFRRRARVHGAPGQLLCWLLEPLDFLMSVQQLKGIKARAETMAYVRQPAMRELEIPLD